MRNIKLYLKNFFQNKKYTRRLIIASLLCIFLIITFLVCRHYLSSNKNTGVKLYYEFGPNTVKYAFNEPSNRDISEQFLSYGISYGIDVSEWQGKIDWEKVRATGISFVMIRCGFRETVGSNIKEDAMFKENIEGATKAGLNVGVYFFGTAKNQEEALEEAEFTINLIKDYRLSYPIAYDTESFDKGRLKGVSSSTITDNVLTYTETVGSYGYDTMVYSYYNAFANQLDTGKLDGKLIWLAHFTDSTNYKGNYNMWQYTSEGKVDGIKTYVDLNVSYFHYVDDENEIVVNPNYVKAPDIYFSPVEENVTTTREATIRSNASLELPNKLGTIKRGTSLRRIGISENISKVIYNDKEVFIANDAIRIQE